MKILRITLSNLRKKKGAVISLGILIVLCSLLMNISLNLILDSRNIILDRVEEMHGPHFSMLMGSNKYMPEYRTFFEEDPRVTETEVEQVIAMENAKTNYGNGEMELAAYFMNAGEERSILPLRILQQAETLPEDAIFLPIGIKDGSPGIGGEFPVIYKNRVYRFTVAGYYETPLCGTTNTGIVRYYLSDNAYRNLSEEIGTVKLISMRLNNPEDSDALKVDFKKFTDGALSGDMLASMSQIGYAQMQYVGTVMPNMLSTGLMGFSAIILLVVAFVAKFRISANIEENVHNIGALGAIGYTSGQIMAAILMEYVAVALAGSVIGVMLADAFMPALGRMLTSISGVTWDGGAAFLPGLLSSAFLLLFVLAVTVADVLHIRRLPPVVALRGGLATHSFHKNWFALHKSGGGVNLRLSGKYAAQNPKQNILLGVVVTGVTFIMLLAILLYNNMVKDQTALIRMCGIELADVVVHLTNHTEAEAMEQELEQRSGVRKISMVDVATVEINDNEVMAEISDDFSHMETMNVYEGEFPHYENETVITGVMAKEVGKKIGDTIAIAYGGVSAEYLITGLTQSTNQGGLLCFMTLDGFRRLDSYYMQESISIYLEDGIPVEIFMDELEQDYGVLPVTIEDGGEREDGIDAVVREKMSNLLTMYGTDSLQYALMKEGRIILSGSSEDYSIESLENYRSKIQAQIYSMGQMFASLTQVIVLFSVFIIGLILNMLIRAMIRRYRKEYGVLKALGYTSGQLTLQIMGSILPSALLGSALGGIMGSLFAAPVFSAMFYTVGISNMLLVMSPWTVLAVCGAVVLTALICACVSARHIRRVSVYGLMTE